MGYRISFSVRNRNDHIVRMQVVWGRKQTHMQHMRGATLSSRPIGFQAANAEV